MAATAYAALVSLLNTMDHIQIHPRFSTWFKYYWCGNRIFSRLSTKCESLRQKLDFFLDFVESYSDADSEYAEDLLWRIAVAAQEAEDVIEVKAADVIRGGGGLGYMTLLPDLQKMMNSIKEKFVKFKEETGPSIYSVPSSSSSSSSSLSTAKTSCMVGFELYLKKLLDELTGHHSDRRRILPIVGMGGIGKTTLARNVYQNSFMVYHFDVRVWVTISQSFSLRDIILQALSCLGGITSKSDKSDDELGEELYKILSGRRYLVVLDDLWSVEAWEQIKLFFPENCNRSRIVVTTRQQQLVDYFASSAIAPDFLDHKNSWDLFCDKTFSQQGCPTELQEIGKKIVNKCKGLPLAISVVGGLLRKSPRTQEYWDKIAQDKSMVLEYSGDEGKNMLSILYLSYKHLPVCLKSCFLYLGLFPEDHDIDVSQLIKLLVAQGYAKPSINQTLEEVAESYIKELVDRNLLLVGDLRRLNKKLRTCRLHDLVREVSKRIGDKEKFYCVQRDIDGRRHFIVDETSASIYPRESLNPSEKPSVMRPTVIFDGEREVGPVKSRLLRVLVDDDMRCLDPTFQQVNLRFLSQTFKFSSSPMHSSISQYWSLQTLILERSCSVVVPSEIWKMPQLRHIEIKSMYLPDPPSGDAFVLQNLQTLKRVENLNFSEEVCKRIPNIKDLEINYIFVKQVGTSSCFHLHNVGCFNTLESLRYSCIGKEYGIGEGLQNLKLPSSLKELTLDYCHLVWSDVAMIASLPRLQILELQRVKGSEWNCVEEEFLCLKHLSIDYCDDLIYWIADRSNFPVLETLHLTDLFELDEIPSGIGEIPTLENMDLFNCSESASMSAIKILEEQESLGNEGLQVRLNFSDEIEEDMWREKVQELGFTSQNLHISIFFPSVEDFPFVSTSY